MEFLHIVLSEFPLYAGICLFSFGIFIGVLLSPLETYLHEIGHCIAIEIKKNEIDTYNSSASPQVILNYKLWIFTDGHTESEFLKFLSNNQPKYVRQIRYIARAGALFSSIFYISLGVVFLALYMTISMLFLIGCGIFTFFLLRSLLAYWGSKKAQCDRDLVKHPEKYVYPYQ